MYIMCDETGNINMVMIEDAEGNEPNFYGVRIGMDEAEVTGKLQEIYPVAEKTEEGNAYVNMSTGGTVLCKMNSGTVESITYMVFSQEELQDYVDVSGEYIFPDSNSKYLSEDEVRAVEAHKLFIGRNEIFARHGYIFDDEGLREHFANTSWYKGTVQGNQFNADEVFNDFEKKNVELIKRIEDEVNGVANQFIGLTGVYICTTPEMDGLTGKIEILDIGDNSIQYSLGSLEMPYSLATGEAQIIDGSTAQAKMQGFTFTLSWSDAENLYVTNEGELTGMDSGTIMSITDGMSYTRPTEFN